MLTSIIDQKEKNKKFIEVSKRCCYLCELYIDFARSKEYNIIVSENIRKYIINGTFHMSQITTLRFNR